MIYTIVYARQVVKEDIPKLSQAAKAQIKKSIEQKLVMQPDLFGKPLRRSLKGYRKLRVGQYRVIFRIDKKTVKILVIQHRSRLYKGIEKRL